MLIVSFFPPPRRPENIMLSFNGGKDCTALLHLLYAVLNRHSGCITHPRLLYVRAQTPFPEVETFVQSAMVYYRYPLAIIKQDSPQCNGDSAATSSGGQCTLPPNLIIYDGSIKSSLARLKEDAPNVKAIFLGTRSSDPWTGKLSLLYRTHITSKNSAGRV